MWMGATDGTSWATYDADVVHPAASTLKLPLLVAVHQAGERGDLSLTEQLPVHADFVSAVPGEVYTTTADYDNDPAVWAVLGRSASIGWLAERAIVRSSNLATNLLIERVGIDAVNAVYRDVGATESVLLRGIQDDPAGAAGLANVATAADMARVVVGLLDGSLLSPAAARAAELTLASCEDDDAIPTGLPAGTYVAHKPGWIDGACHDVALVRPLDEPPFILSVFTAARLDDAEIHALVAEVARVCWRDRPAPAAARRPVRIRDAGPADWPRVWPVFDAVVRAGDSYAFPLDLDLESARAWWMEELPGRTVIAEDGDQLLGTAKMGPNRPGRGSHVATASFMVDEAARGRGVGRALVDHVIGWARAAGYRGIQFNAVVETNTAAVDLWQAVGFEIVGTVPRAFDHPVHGFVGLHVMYRSL